MVQRKVSVVATLVCSMLAFWGVPAFAQFTASIQGAVQDTSGASVAKAQINLVNNATGVIKTTATDSAGNYRFVSLAPGNYKI
ncbi:MAG TPA: carboxypeptidase-like regulatory domain-containing protein, partial [Terracidiphilus sp.]|nr:carboxypeptidase-like regulatory domain-containing protein [Terracidiphilus sp.]